MTALAREQVVISDRQTPQPRVATKSLGLEPADAVLAAHHQEHD
jgi:hypothetical protein